MRGSPPPLQAQHSGIFLSLNWVIHPVEITLQQAMLSARNGPPPWTGPPPRSRQLPNCTDTEAPNTDTYKTMILTVGERNGQSSPEIYHAGKSLLSDRHARSGAQPYLEGIRIRPRRTRRQPERDVLHVRGIAADLPARRASDGDNRLKSFAYALSGPAPKPNPRKPPDAIRLTNPDRRKSSGTPG